MATSQVSCRLLHHGVAANSSSKVVLCMPPNQCNSETSEIVYASHAMINVAHQCTVNLSGREEVLWKVHQTLRTDTTASSTANATVATATAKRMITCLSLLQRRIRNSSKHTNSVLPTILCGFSDGTLTLWNRDDKGQWVEVVLVDSVDEDCDGRAITDIVGLVDDSGNIAVVACTSGGAFYFTFPKDAEKERKCILHTPSNTVSSHTLESGATLFLVGTAAPRHNKIHVFLDDPSKPPHYCGALTGHEDWITCFDWLETASGDYLASGSQDARIRLWKFYTTTSNQENLQAGLPELEERGNGDDDEEDDHEEEEVEEGESRLEIFFGGTVTSVVLEALLIGHEERVTSVSWHPNPKPVYGQELILVSSSMDRTIFVWSEHESGVWTPVSRVGSAGGILGGSIGSSLLGFLNVKMEPNNGRWMLGHGYGGALHVFSCQTGTTTRAGVERLNEESTVEERAALAQWRAQPCITGHFDGVSDLCWEAESGDYLVTVGTDQTCRVWSSLELTNQRGSEPGEMWVEIARPQVHGYDLSTITSLSTAAHRHTLVSGADEKELRIFDATKAFENVLGLVSREGSANTTAGDQVERVERAYIPSLGLSNKATASEGAEEDTDKVSESSSQLPLERDLGAVSLWPEVGKLYGHNTELMRLTSTVAARTAPPTSDSNLLADDVIVASSAKARDAEAARIRLWNVRENKCMQVLDAGHRSTVAALSFSPDGRFLASSGKDRRLCIWERGTGAGESSRDFFLACAVDSAHKRIIWGVHFCPFDPTILASGSRDGTIKIWHLSSVEDSGTHKTAISESCSFNPMCVGSNGKPEAVTSLAFAPLPLSSTCALLAVGLENGLLELWKVPLAGRGQGEQPEAALCISQQSCHIASVTKLAWRPERTTLTSDRTMHLASCSSDHGTRIFGVQSYLS